ncbi:MAG: hypothetical protein WDM78_08150 [Puia sp.]
MQIIDHLYHFMNGILEDPRIGPTHISLYVAILTNFRNQSLNDPISVFSRNLMKQSKIAGNGTYYKCLTDLKAAGYIHYIPSSNPFLGSLIYLIANDQS